MPPPPPPPPPPLQHPPPSSPSFSLLLPAPPSSSFSCAFKKPKSSLDALTFLAIQLSSVAHERRGALAQTRRAVALHPGCARGPATLAQRVLPPMERPRVPRVQEPEEEAGAVVPAGHIPRPCPRRPDVCATGAPCGCAPSPERKEYALSLTSTISTSLRSLFWRSLWRRQISSPAAACSRCSFVVAPLASAVRVTPPAGCDPRARHGHS